MRSTYETVDIPVSIPIRKGVVDFHNHCTLDNKGAYGSSENWLRVRSILGIRMVVSSITKGMGCPEVPLKQKHDEALLIRERAPDYFAIFGYVDMDNEGLDKIDWLKSNNFDGVKVHRHEYAHDDDRYMPYYEKISSWGVPILFHTCHRERGKTAPYTLVRLCETFPEWTIIGAHFGSGYHEEADEVYHSYSNLYYDLSGSIVTRYGTDTFVRHLGRRADDWDRTVFGTDGRPETYATWVAAYEQLMDICGVSEPIREKVFFRNALQILGKDERDG